MNYKKRILKDREKSKLKEIRKKQFKNNKRNKIKHFNQYFFLPCIYFLKVKGNIVYIGETISLMTRISQHIKENTKIFTDLSFEVFEGSNKQRKEYERFLIKKHKPFYNIQHNKP